MNKILAAIGVGFVSIVAGSPAWAQYYIQQGQVLDANPRLGSGGLNTSRVYDFQSANRIMTGNVTGGQSFRGFSPVRDASSLFISGLPSDSLSNFTRDSFNISYIQRDPQMVHVARPYYSPQSTVTNTGAIIAGQNRPGTSQVQSPYMVPRPELRSRLTDPLQMDRSRMGGLLLSVPTRLTRVNTGQPITGPVNERLLSSPLFGGVMQVPVNVLAAQAERDQSLGAPGNPSLDFRVDVSSPLDLRIKPNPLESQVYQPPVSRLERWPAEPVDQQLTGPLGTPYVERQSEQMYPGEEPSDVFTRMRRLGEPSAPSPQGPVGRDISAGAAPGAPAQLFDSEGNVPAVNIAERFATAQAVAAEPLKTFVGTEKSQVNQHLAEAEALLKSGQYYQAANLYSLARVVDIRNPLPLLGRAMALLAAGEYMSSVTNLFQAIQLFEPLGHFQIDLTEFIPDVTVLDRRRADLERQLALFDDFRLRFLLGFAEYCSGLEEFGLANLEKAAQAAPAELESIRGFVETLKQRSTSTQKPTTSAPTAR